MDKIINFLNNYLKFNTSIEKNKNIIETTSFEYLKKLEEKGLFNEAPLKKNTTDNVKFFNLGPRNQWAKESNQEIIKEIEKSFSTEMKELNYL